MRSDARDAELPAPSPQPRRRLALVIPSLGGGGAERILIGLANYWSRAGHDVTIVTIAAGDLAAYPVEGRVRRVSLGLLKESRNAAEGAVQGVRRALAMRRALTGIAPDAVVSFTRSVNLFALLATAGTGLPVFACERTDPRLDPGVLRQPAWAALRRVLYPRAAGVVVQTESVAAWARSFCPHVHVIPNFVERPARFAAPAAEVAARRLVAMGRLGPEKGFDLLIDAFARVAATHAEWSLTILGEGRERARLEALVRERRLESRVSLPGRTEDPASELARAHVFALSSRREGFPNVLLEAMAAGLPVVAFDCRSGPSEIIRHDVNGLLVPDGDTAAMAGSLARLMESASDRERLGRRAREVADTFSPQRVLERWNALLQGGGRP